MALRKWLVTGALLLGLLPVCEAQVGRLPDCFLYFSLTDDGSSETYDNRQVGCVDWSMAYSNDGFAALTLTMEQAPVTAGVPGAYVIYDGLTLAGANPMNGLVQDYARFSGYRPYIRATLSATAGAGTLKGIIYGFRTTDAATGTGALVTIDGQPIQVQGNQADGAGADGNPQLVAGWDGATAYTLSTDATGQLQVDVVSSAAGAMAGTLAAGAAMGTQYPVTVSGVDPGGLVRRVLTDVAGNVQVTSLPASPVAVEGRVADGAAAATLLPVMVSGIDAAGNTQNILTNTAGNPQVEGTIADGTAAGTQLPIAISGVDAAGNVQRVITEVDGVLIAKTNIGYQIGLGTHYLATDHVVALGAAATREYRITAPDSAVRCHIVWEGSSNNQILAELFENGNVTVGTAITAVNNDRNSGNTADLVVTHTPAVVADGTLIWAALGGTGKKIGGEPDMQEKLILKQAYTYLLRITATNAGTDITTTLYWYEI